MDNTKVKRRWPRVLGGVLAVLAVVGIVAFQVSPWPSVLVIRALGDDGLDGANANDEFVPEGIVSQLDLPYDPEDEALTLDVFRPADAPGPLPTVVWVHGGGFIGGIKEPLRPYLKVLASHGYTTVNIEYTHAPETQYPTPVLQLSRALEYVVANSASLGVDPDQIVLAGDSAGAHIAGQSAMAISQDAYAQAAGLPQAIDGSALVGVMLFSGPFDLDLTSTDNRSFAWYMRTVLWAYTGEKHFADDPGLELLSLAQHVTDEFPPSFVSTGPYDPLLAHSESLVAQLVSVGAEPSTLFFDAASTPESVGHEYALALSTPQAKQAMVELVAFLRGVSDGPELPGASADW